MATGCAIAPKIYDCVYAFLVKTDIISASKIPVMYFFNKTLSRTNSLYFFFDCVSFTNKEMNKKKYKYKKYKLNIKKLI